MNILITGSSNGFGERTAQHLLRDGHTVFATMRGVDGRNADNAKAIQAFAADTPGTVHVLELDVSSDASVQAAVTKAEGIAPLDVVINNAGYGVGGFAEAFTPEQFTHILDVNVVGVHRVNRAALPAMRKRGKGLLLHISSTMGRVVIPFAGPYTASKFALEGYCESLRYEVSQTGIEVAIVEPGGFGTGFLSAMKPPKDEARQAEYGDLTAIPEQMWGGVGELLQSDDAPDVSMVIDTIVGVINAPHGKRAARTVVDGMGMAAGPEAINNTTDAVQAQILEGMQVAQLGTVKA